MKILRNTHFVFSYLMRQLSKIVMYAGVPKTGKFLQTHLARGGGRIVGGEVIILRLNILVYYAQGFSIYLWRG